MARAVTPREGRVLAAVLRRLLRGEPVGRAALTMATGLTPAEVEAALTRLAATGSIHLDGGAIAATYPLSARPTRHRLSIGVSTAYANCAIDALAVSSMVDEDVGVESDCALCGAAVTVHMRGDHVDAAEPSAPVVFYLPADCCGAGPAVLTRCPYINFFCGAEHAAQWMAAHPERRGTVLRLAEAIAVAREGFAAVARLVHGKDVSMAALWRHRRSLPAGGEE